MKTPQQAAQGVAAGVHRLQSHLSRHHFTFRGTLIAAIAEAQGAGMLPDRGTGQRYGHLSGPARHEAMRRAAEKFRQPIDHLSSLVQGRDGAENGVNRLHQVLLTDIMPFDPMAGGVLSVVVNPLVGLAGNRVSLADDTRQFIEDLRQRGHGSRLAGAPVATAGRTEKGLITSQLESIPGPRWPGERDLLPREMQGSRIAGQLLDRIMALPLDEPGATATAAGEAAKSRQLLAEFSRHSEAKSDILTAVSAGLLRAWSVSGELQGQTVRSEPESYVFPASGGGEAGGGAGGDSDGS